MMNASELLSLLDTFIDDRVDAFGIRNTIAYLLDNGVTPEDLVNQFRFDQEDVNEVVDAYNDPDKDPYDEFFGI